MYLAIYVYDYLFEEQERYNSWYDKKEIGEVLINGYNTNA
jgi:hypothetical protein